MNMESWIVRTVGGEEWGFIKRLIIDSATRQIRDADVILADTGKIVRIAWDNFDLQNEGIRLMVAQGDVHANEMKLSEVAMAHSVSMDLWP